MVFGLVENFCCDEDFIFFEGQYICGYLWDEWLKNWLKLVCIYNIEWEYYVLFNEWIVILKNCIYYWLESKKLKCFDKVLKSVDVLFCVFYQDLEYYWK